MGIASASLSQLAAAETPTPFLRNVRVPASRIENARALSSLPFDLRKGIGPDEAALIATYQNLALRVERARRGLAQAQIVQAGVLPNPQVTYERNYVTGGNTFGTQTAYNFAAGWEVTSLLPLIPREHAARANLRSVDLDIAWQEWRIAQEARTAVYRVVALEEELASARQADRELSASTETLKRAMEAHEKTVLDYGAAAASALDARAIALGVEQEYEKQRLLLKKTLGLEPEAEVRLRDGIGLPSELALPDERMLNENLENRRLDLIALQEGYRSQEATVRAAFLSAFPKISIGFVKATDTTNVQTEGFAITADVPIFDRHQGVIASERATRQKLLDEFHLRVFEARADIATALAEVRSLNRQVAAAEEALPVFENLVSSAGVALQQGNTDVLAYYNARSGLLQRRIQLIRLKEQLLEAKTALELASGRFLPSNAAMDLK
ncbi:MAG: TolC family protein [Chthoniobacterales bacterium]